MIASALKPSVYTVLIAALDSHAIAFHNGQKYIARHFTVAFIVQLCIKIIHHLTQVYALRSV